MAVSTIEPYFVFCLQLNEFDHAIKGTAFLSLTQAMADQVKGPPSGYNAKVHSNRQWDTCYLILRTVSWGEWIIIIWCNGDSYAKTEGSGDGEDLYHYFTLLTANKPPVLKWEAVQTWLFISGSLFTVCRGVAGVLRVQPVSRRHAIYIITNWATGIGTKVQHPKPCVGNKKTQK